MIDHEKLHWNFRGLQLQSKLVLNRCIHRRHRVDIGGTPFAQPASAVSQLESAASLGKGRRRPFPRPLNLLGDARTLLENGKFAQSFRDSLGGHLTME